MNLFLLHWSSSRSAQTGAVEHALARLVDELPFFERDAIATWRAPSGNVALAYIAHEGAQAGGVTYQLVEPDRMVLFSGRPYIWTDEFEADGRAALDPGFYLRPLESWAGDLDGRCVVVRYDDAEQTLEVIQNPFGGYHLFATARNGDWWLSPNAEILRRLSGSTRSRPEALASFFASGSSFGGEPRWEGVERLSATKVYRFRGGESGEPAELPNEIDRERLFARPFSRERAAATLVAAMGALADWDGRRNIVGISGGRDSRVVLAAASRGRFDFEARTMTFPEAVDFPETADVRIARELCEAIGCSHQIVEQEQLLRPGDAARMLRLISPGGVSLDLATQGVFARPLPARGDPLELVHTGQGGEVARAWFGSGEGLTARQVAVNLYRRTVNRWPRSLLSRDGAAVYRDLLEGWVGERAAAGVPVERLPDLFYVEERMEGWTASQAVMDYSYELTNPFFSRRLLPYEVAVSPGERSHDRFHVSMLEALAPELLEIPFDQRPPWAGADARRQSAPKLFHLAEKIVRELRRQALYLRGRAPAGSPRDPFNEAMAETRRKAGAWSSHEAWEVLDRKRVASLLSRRPHTLDARSRRLVWRLATVFLDKAPEESATKSGIDSSSREQAEKPAHSRAL